ncbi:hypothetical protein [Mycolicibacterium sp.]|uniref:hypothetical protein n=2 Tax=Mycolicibacterium sp. TaxID=2320850 RepID=UPI0037C6C32A
MPERAADGVDPFAVHPFAWMNTSHFSAKSEYLLGMACTTVKIAPQPVLMSLKATRDARHRNVVMFDAAVA